MWMDLFPTAAEGADSVAVRQAWEHYRMLLTLTEQLPEEGYAPKHGQKAVPLTPEELEQHKKSINIIPHVGESGLSVDNFAFSKEKQREIISKRNPNIIKSFDNGSDFREAQTITGKSNWSKFLNWAIKNPKCFAKGSDGVYRGIIFTHSHFLQNSFQSDKIKNNNGIHVVINTESTNYDIPSKSNYKLLSIGNTDTINGPDKCRISPYTRKNSSNYKSSRLTRKN